MMHELQQTFHSIIKSLEILYVIEGTKTCARILAYEDELNKIIAFLNKKNLNAAISDFKVLKQSAQSEFYSDKSIKISKNDDRRGYFFVYISKNKKIANEAKILEEYNSHKELGLVLGYPKCCCDFFVDNFNERNTDLTLNILKNSEGYEFPFYTNIAARHFDISLPSHFPHSFNCEPSIGIAKKNFEIIKKHSKQASELFSQVLRSAVIYTLEEGVFILKNYQKIDDELIYTDVLTTTKSKLYYLLSSNRKLEIVDKNCFIVNDVKINGDNYGVMIFNKNP